MRKFLTTTAMIALAVAGAGASARAADVKEVQMLHWWTSGGEAAALNVLKQDLSKEGYAWKDVPVAGGGGDAAMTALKAMVAAGNYPTASQMLGYTVLDYAQEGVMGDLTATAKKEGWDKSVPKALQKFAVYNGKWVAAPVNVHSVNWLWINKAVMDKIGGKQPKTFAELIALLDKAKAAGVVPLALGGQNWQEATMFDSIVLSTGGPEFYKKAFNDLDEASLKSDTMKKSFDNLATIVKYVDPNFSGRDWNLATAMVIKGDALVQVMGDWAKGEFVAAKKTPGTDYLCYRFPGTEGSVIYNSDMFGMFNVPADRKAAQVALATATLSKSFQSAFNVVKGSVPARTDVPDTAFDACGKKGIADLKAANEGGTLFGSLAQGYGAPPAIANAYKDVVSKFVHGQIKTSDEAVKQLVQAIDDAR
ncbi:MULTISPECIES: ABC transporter substrate-binding protein [Rhizobium]|jgi:glucose/mannose transport system substrate-binding protein|uniref:Probable sugar-binding periplasmic protein n=1 Tax=Rhizobium lusitanum TaxID=293958 RepID=A0A1C3WPN9_9HYPH|nr:MULTISPECIES: ABC transporter substrate-binding protein [Rhizobium]NRP87159.1 putative sugar-binding periplasmic protein [Ensifer adhaerens]NKJ06642.1 glucose/mannose transport system substrate-binding protein [Rhizobium sp. SG741]NKJ40020.1 glucose/mannose transport system substrate-binding protein [Rhizobium sp. SG570]NTJ10538.1 carbohydrate ABC transporter substrate-binding protein [Rhizobium lusitanum]SCB41939.1 carbohydrate ABC transporter substrate-binding protein, CUT1 family [Rhizob